MKVSLTLCINRDDWLRPDIVADAGLLCVRLLLEAIGVDMTAPSFVIVPHTEHDRWPHWHVQAHCKPHSVAQIRDAWQKITGCRNASLQMIVKGEAKCPPGFTTPQAKDFNEHGRNP